MLLLAVLLVSLALTAASLAAAASPASSPAASAAASTARSRLRALAGVFVFAGRVRTTAAPLRCRVGVRRSATSRSAAGLRTGCGDRPAAADAVVHVVGLQRRQNTDRQYQSKFEQ